MVQILCDQESIMKEIRTSEWESIRESLNARGFVVVPSLLSVQECDYFISQYDSEVIYRNTINMQRYRFGKGEYKYFGYPLPGPLESVRTTLYPNLVPVANDWMRALSLEISFPVEHSELL